MTDVSVILAPLLGIVVLIVGLAYFAIDAGCGAIEHSFGPAPPADEKIIADFSAHRQEYEELVSMFQADSQLDAIRDASEATAGVVSASRSERYHTLLDSLQLEEISRRAPLYTDQSGVFFRMGSFGIVPSGSFWGVAYLDSEPSPLVADTQGNETSSEHAYRRIEGNWYVWREWW